MLHKKGFWFFLALIVLGSILAFFNKPKQSPFPFAGAIEQLPDYRPPMSGLTLYPTGGPFGLDIIESIAVGPTGTLFVGTYGGGLFKSVDEGQHWEPSNIGLKEKFISSIMTLDAGKVFAGTVRAGLFQSQDDGFLWTSSNLGLEDVEVHTLLLRDSGEILAGTSRGPYLSQDDGASWRAFNEGLRDIRIQSIVETKDKTLYVGTLGHGIFKRESSGTEWESVIIGFSFQGLLERNIRTLVLGKDEALFAGTMSAGIFRSLDGGVTWEIGNAGLGNYSIRTLSTDAKENLYAGTGEGVYFSQDQGARWFPLLDGMENIQIHSFVVNQSGDLYVGSSDGVYRGGIQMAWEPLHEELLISPVLALNQGEEGVTVGTHGKGTYIHQKGNWVSDNVGLVNLSILAMARGQTYLYAITQDGVYRRQLGRHRWEPLEGRIPGEPTAIGVDASGLLYVASTSGLFSSGDQGGRWEKIEVIGSEPVKDLAIQDQAILVATEDSLWSKLPEGQWEKVETRAGSHFQHVLWRPNAGLQAVSNNELWGRDAKGDWQALNGGLPTGLQIKTLVADPDNSDVLYLGTDRGLFWSGDNGETWDSAFHYQGQVYEGQVNRILPAGSNAIWLATQMDGVVLGISKIPRKNLLLEWLNRIM